MRLLMFFCVFVFNAFLTLKAQPSDREKFEFHEDLDSMYNYAWNDPVRGLIEARLMQQKALDINYDAGYCNSVLFEADCYISKGNYPQAIEKLFYARDLAEEINSDTLYQLVSRPFGKLYILIGDKERAVTFQKDAISRDGKLEEAMIATHGLGEAYLIAGELDSALGVAEPLYEQIGHLWSAPIDLLGDVYLELGKYEEALEVYKGDPLLYFLIDSLDILIGKSKALYELGKTDSARISAESALALSEERQFYRLIRDASEVLAKIYKPENIEKYATYLDISYAAKDTLFGQERIFSVFDLILDDESRRRDFESEQKQMKANQRSLGFAGVAAFLLFGGLLLWRNNRLKANANRLLALEKSNVEKALAKLRVSEKVNEELKQKELERLREIDQVKTRFYTNITHEFRTPLTVILGMVENIEGNEEEKKLIKRNSNGLLQLINQLLDLSRIDSGFIKVNVRKGDIISYLHYLTESFYSMASDKKVKLNFHTEVRTLQMDYDEQKVRHIIYNLLSNAIKFTQAGGKVTVTIQKRSDDLLQIKLRDTGVGINEKDLPYIFDRFYQTDESYSSGTGVGLALVSEMTQLMKGDVTVHSEEGWGTEFTINMPIKNEEGIEPITEAYQTEKIENEITDTESIIPLKPDQLNGEKLTILITEDNLGVVTYIQSILKDDYHTLVAMNGIEGKELALEHIPDLVISDVMMPEMNGYELTKYLKSDSKTSHIPIIMLTAKADFESRITGLEYGADAYLSKPFEKVELLTRIKKLIELRVTLQQKYMQNHLGAEEAVGKPDKEDEFLMRIREIVLQQLENTKFNVAELASIMFVSHTQLYRKVKALTGLTPNYFMRKIKLNISTEYLRTQERTIAEVAYSSGFSDPNYFSRVFKKEFGVSPVEYRDSR